MNMQEFALNMLAKNPNIQNNPMAQQMIEVIKSNDSSKGEQIANNLLSTYGLSKDEAISQARSFFKI